MPAKAPAFGGGEFMVSGGADAVLVSPDGLEWREERLPRPATLAAFSYVEAARRWVTAGLSGEVFTRAR
ncbi:MAG: hypothetical protein ABWJ63_03130 [Thermus sp.]|uniref:hypothetical protein n=1 Tax=Thermus sp. TaxID=275 RepID=UPI00351BA4F0